MSIESYNDVRRLTRDLRTVAEWQEDYDSRLRRAELCFQTIGLSEERRAELVHEGETLKRIYRVLAEERLT